MSSAIQASAKRRTSSCSVGELGSGARPRSDAGNRRPVVIRAPEGAFDRVLACLERVGYLGGVEAEDVAEKQDGALAWWEMLQGCDERELDGLPGLVSSVWTRRRIDDPLEQGSG